MELKFIDISNWQAGLDVASVVRNGGLGGIIVKATEGLGLVDRSCDNFVQQAVAGDIPFGFYHFGRNNDASAEAEFFRNNTKGYEGRGVPVLDWEADQSVAWVNEFVYKYHALTGVWPWVYGNAWRFNQGTVNENCGRWIAGYPSNGITDIDYGLSRDCPYRVNNGLATWTATCSTATPTRGLSTPVPPALLSWIRASGPLPVRPDPRSISRLGSWRATTATARLAGRPWETGTRRSRTL